MPQPTTSGDFARSLDIATQPPAALPAIDALSAQRGNTGGSMPLPTTQGDSALPLDIDALPASALLTRAQVAEVSGFALITLKQWAAQGRGPKITRVEGLPRFRACDVRSWMGGIA